MRAAGDTAALSACSELWAETPPAVVFGSTPRGALAEPLHGSLAATEDGYVSVLRGQPEFCRGAVAGEPLAVRAGHDPVAAAVHYQGRSFRPRRVEPPRGDGG